MRPRYRKADVERLIWKPQLWKMKSAFWELGQEHLRSDPNFRFTVHRIRAELNAGRLNKQKADDLYFQALDESIRRARAQAH